MGQIASEATARPGAGLKNALVGALVGGAAIVALLIGAGPAMAGAPVTTATADPAPNGSDGWYRTSVAVSVTLEAQDTGTGVDEIRYRWHNDLTGEFSNWTVVDGDEATFPALGGEGIKTLQFYAVDGGGVEEEVKTFEIKRDTTPPLPRAWPNPLVPNGIGGTWLPGTEMFMQAIDTPPPGQNAGVTNPYLATVSGVDETTIEHRLKGGNNWVDGDVAIPMDEVGTYEFEARASDIAGNQSNVTTLGPFIVEEVTPGLKVAMKANGKKKTKRRKAVTYKVTTTNNYVEPMNLQTQICANPNKNNLAKVQFKADQVAVTKWTKGKCATHYSLGTDASFAPQFKVTPTKKAANRAKKGKKVKVKITFRTSVPGVGSRTQAITLQVTK